MATAPSGKLSIAEAMLAEEALGTVSMTDSSYGFATSTVPLSPVHSPLRKSCMGASVVPALGQGQQKTPGDKWGNSSKCGTRDQATTVAFSDKAIDHRRVEE